MDIATLQQTADTAHNAYKLAFTAWQMTRSASDRAVAGELGAVSANAEMALLTFKNQNGLA